VPARGQKSEVTVHLSVCCVARMDRRMDVSDDDQARVLDLMLANNVAIARQFTPIGQLVSIRLALVC